MSGGAGLIAFIFTMFVMIVFHEFGHFITAKRVGMKVEEFSIGFGPRLWMGKRGETVYSIRGLPLGGYVKIAGMNPFRTVPESEMPRTYGAKPAWQRAIVLSAGSATHIVLAIVVIFAMLTLLGEPLVTTTIDVIQQRVAGQPGPASQAGLRPGDKVVEVDGVRVTSWEQFRGHVRARAGSSVKVSVLRDGVRQTFVLTPVEVEIEETPGKRQKVGQIGVLPTSVNDPQPVHIAAWNSIKYTGLLVAGSVYGIVRVFSPSGLGSIFNAIGDQGERDENSPTGVVGGGRVAAQAAASGEIQVLIWILVGFIVFVGVINLAPLPPFDGGHLLVLVIEKVRRRRVDMRKVVPVAVFVFGFLMVLQFALLYLDIFRPIANPFQ